MKFYFFLLFLLMTGCAGYRVNDESNPFISYGVHSVAVPMFVNRSNIENVSGPVTKEIIRLLNQYSKLKVVAGDSDQTDAVLIGVVDSDRNLRDSTKSDERLFTTDKLAESIGARPGFYVPAKTSYTFKMSFYLIKRPTEQERKLFLENGQFAKFSPKVVLSETIDLTNSYKRVVNPTNDTAGGGDANFVKNKGLMEKSIQEFAILAAQNFKDVVLNAF